jgi:outer membrane protein assembly factor BamA
MYMDGKDSTAEAEMTKAGVDLGNTIESKISPTFMWDNRNNIYWSTKGYYAGLTFQLSSEFLASSNDFYILSGFASGYHRLIPGKDRLTLGWRFFMLGSKGDIPYDQLAMYSRGDKVMGYTPGKYVNNGEVNGQVEVRYDIWKFIAGSGFFSMGKVFPNLKTFGQSVWLPSGGVNLYITLIPYRNIRMRLSGVLANKDWGVYIGVGQMF